MWRLLKESVEGTAHRRTGAPCQDSCAGTATRPGQEDFLVLACADGAGSAELSGEGSARACQRFVELACEALQRGEAEALLTAEGLRGCLRQVHEALVLEAERRGVPVRQLACTLLAAVVGESACAFAQVGDGAIVVREGERYAPVFWPQAGEYVNTTHFITEAEHAQLVQVAVRGRVDEVAMLTDGLQMLALNYATRDAHAPFFAPMFSSLRGAEDPEDLVVPMRSFLDSPAVNERTDDDKTLILAVRVGRAADAAVQSAG